MLQNAEPDEWLLSSVDQRHEKIRLRGEGRSYSQFSDRAVKQNLDLGPCLEYETTKQQFLKKEKIFFIF